MERVGVLINKLKNLLEKSADANQLLKLTKELQLELQKKLLIDNNQSADLTEIKSKSIKKVTKATNEFASIPTLIYQDKKTKKELNEALALQHSTLNDKLKEEKKEIAEALQDSKIVDLKKSIGINDKYLFISKLFRNDEITYERSVKTINSLNSYFEAEYWIQRELKVKLGWDEFNETVKLFYQYVRRRFS